MPIVDAIDSRVRGPRSLIILAVYVVLLGSVAVIGYVVVPSLIEQVRQISHDAPRYAYDLRHNATFRHYDNRYHITAKLRFTYSRPWRTSINEIARTVVS